jgi:hypothetical protein
MGVTETSIGKQEQVVDENPNTDDSEMPAMSMP